MSVFRLRFAIYILMVVFAVQKLSHKANITSSSNISTNEPDTNNLVDANNIVPPVQTKLKQTSNQVIPNLSEKSVSKEVRLERPRSPIALPESLVIPEIATEASRTSNLSTIIEQDVQKAVVPTVVSPGPQALSTSIALGTEATSAQTSAEKDGSMSLMQSVAPQASLATRLATVKNQKTGDLQEIPTLNQNEMLLSRDTPTREETVNPQPTREVVAQAISIPSYPQGLQPFAGETTEVQKNLPGEQYGREIIFEQKSTSSPPSLTPGLRPTALIPPPPFTVALSGTEAHRFNEPLIEPLTTGFPPSPSATLKVGTENWATSALSPQVKTLQTASLPSMAQRQIPPVAQATVLAELQSGRARDLGGVLPLNQNARLLAFRDTPTHPETANLQQREVVVAQGTLAQSRPEVETLQDELRSLEEVRNKSAFQASPALSVVIPTGFGLDNNTGFISAAFQQRTRDISGLSDGGLGIGIGLGDARKLVGVELSYTTASFGSSRDFGSGGFNAKVHRRLGNDLAVAAGWNGFLNVGDENDFENSVYGVVTKIIRTRDNINSPLSRIAITAGVGSGQFRTENAVANDSGGVNVFGNIAVRVAQPVSLIAEWSGQDLGVGLSIAPFKNIPLVITPAVRDLAGAGDEPRFVLGTGFAFRF